MRLTNPLLNTADRQVAELPGIFRRYRGDISRGLRENLSMRRSHVYDMLRYYMGWVDVDGNPYVATEGKALRPTLCLFACEATGGAWQMALPAATALEYIHNFSLIHDDIQDRDETRHHRKTLWPVWGVPKALVAGNVLRVVADMALERLVDEGMEPRRAIEAIGLLTEAYLEMIEGQYLDLSFEGRPDIGMSDYLAMISRKTGALIRCALNLGAFIGTRDEAAINALKECGRALGYVFQIIDDVLGVWGDEDVTGKPVGADIRRKKNSFPVVHAMTQARGGDRQRLLEIYAKEELDDEDVDTALEVMERARTREFAEDLAAEHACAARQAIASVELAQGFRQQIDDLTEFLLVRQH